MPHSIAEALSPFSGVHPRSQPEGNAGQEVGDQNQNPKLEGERGKNEAQVVSQSSDSALVKVSNRYHILLKTLSKTHGFGNDHELIVHEGHGEVDSLRPFIGHGQVGGN